MPAPKLMKAMMKQSKTEARPQEIPRASSHMGITMLDVMLNLGCWFMLHLSQGNSAFFGLSVSTIQIPQFSEVENPGMSPVFQWLRVERVELMACPYVNRFTDKPRLTILLGLWHGIASKRCFDMRSQAANIIERSKFQSAGLRFTLSQFSSLFAGFRPIDWICLL
ncbi:MAG: hypothetical protein D6732_04555 [Methanobacteriota archaeon]|nr:MAG: hypothetical protein D6732_04555 [Euryarchaeota archaeon]